MPAVRSEPTVSDYAVVGATGAVAGGTFASAIGAFLRTPTPAGPIAWSQTFRHWPRWAAGGGVVGGAAALAIATSKLDGVDDRREITRTIAVALGLAGAAALVGGAAGRYGGVYAHEPAGTRWLRGASATAMLGMPVWTVGSAMLQG